MILTENIKLFIERKIGADINLLGIKSVESAIHSGMKRSKVNSVKEYEKLIKIDIAVYNSFIEDIIVPKTWFFRNKGSFLFLKEVIINELNNKPFLKILSIPCSTGEEPYSIAATAFEAGLNKNQFHIDAMDISNNAISIAESGVYPKNHSYLEAVEYSKRYIYENNDSIIVDDKLKDQISFLNENLLDIGNNNTKYDVIFCRNVFIYFNQKARNLVLSTLNKKLKKDGMIFTGHAELNIFLNSGYVKVDSRSSFACKLGEKKEIKFISKRASKKKVLNKKKKFVKVIAKKPEIVNEIENTIEEKTITYDMIKSLADLGNYQKAMELCNFFIMKSDPNAEIYCLKGLIHQLKNNLDMAQECFEKSIYLKPDYYDALLHMSLLLEKKGNFTKAKLFKNRAKRSFVLNENNESDFLEQNINE